MRLQPGAGRAALTLLEQLAGREDAPPEIRAPALVLLRLLAGETSLDLSGLPPKLAGAVRAPSNLQEEKWEFGVIRRSERAKSRSDTFNII